MARYEPAEHIYLIAEQWARDCLIGDGSLLWPGEPAWSTETVERFKACFVDRPDTSAASFEEKFKRQLADEPDIVTRLACEMLLVYFLYPTNVSGRRKRELIAQVAGWKGLQFPPADTPALRALDRGIGSGGMGYNLRRPFELAYFVMVTQQLKTFDRDERAAILADHKRLAALLDGTAVPQHGAGQRYQIRHVLAHLLLPDRFERMATEAHKQRAVAAFADELDAAPSGDIDDRLYAIRRRLEERLPDETLDFYEPPLRERWYPPDEDGPTTTGPGERCWVVRAGRNDEAATLFREGKVVALGWREMGDLARLPADREAFKQAVAAAYPSARPGAVANFAGQLYRYVHEMQPGDVVVYPATTGSDVMIGRIAGPYVYAPERNAEYPQIRPVEWEKAVTRSTLSKEARTEISALMTLFQVRQRAAEFAALLAGKPPTIVTTGPEPPIIVTTGPEPPDAAFLTEIAEALDRKGQLILLGPPGTGKTYTARRFAVWWLLRESPGVAVNTVLTDPAAFVQAEAGLAAPIPGGAIGRLTYLTFHPSYAYEDFVEGYKPTPSQDGALRLALEDGVFKRVCREAARRPTERFLVLVDEINRANIAKVFGELITLLERDKRGMTVILPQSKEPFAIPPNVYVVGTMNTADKSIKLLDAALRRRFAFAELLPDPSLLAGVVVRGLALDAFLAELNRRVARREGREKQIGHSFLLEAGRPVTEPEEVARRVRQEILPLLQEYCYDDYAELAEYVGEALVDKEGQRLNEPILDDSDALLDALAAEFAVPPTGLVDEP
jgi:MoxR-like ATPase